MVTGANRGIGLEFVRQLVKLPQPPRFVFATYRNESTVQNLKEIQDKYKETQVVLIQMDISKISDIESAKIIIEENVGEKGLNLLINNAGAARFLSFPEITEEDMLFHFTTNAVGPVMVLKVMLPLLKKSAAQKTSDMNVSRAAVINISTTMGSLTELIDGQPREWLQVFGYRTRTNYKTGLFDIPQKELPLSCQSMQGLLNDSCCNSSSTEVGVLVAVTAHGPTPPVRDCINMNHASDCPQIRNRASCGEHSPLGEGQAWNRSSNAGAF
ncbi:hypothetical protein AVEN_274396-1 [Araneus ventricosus]|uniref:C-factor n=1 Tax=Araneus ventricosus TaxID=182803 RepID=A0A4Y2TE09_ARAVE|nr:hypothetical protein AVEN_274396-1 [Araneus ventricosus]